MTARRLVVLLVSTSIAVGLGLYSLRVPTGRQLNTQNKPTARGYRISFILSNDVPALQNFITETVKNCEAAGLALVVKKFYHHQDSALLKNQIEEAIMWKSDVLVSIGAIAAQGIKSCLSKRQSPLPHIFTCVPDPLTIGISKGKYFTGDNSTGIAENSAGALEVFANTLATIKPNIKKVAVFHSKAPLLAEKTEELRLMLLKKGIETESITASTAEEVHEFVHAKISPAVDLVLLLRDGVILGHLQKILRKCRMERVPCIASDPQSAVEGAAAAISVEEKELTKLAAKMIIKVLKGKKSAGSIPIAHFSSAELYKLYVNRRELRAQGMNMKSLAKFFVSGQPQVQFIG